MLRLLLLFVLLMGCWSLDAQTYVGIIGGGGLNSNVGLRAGVQAKRSFKNWLSGQTEIAFTNRSNAGIVQRLPGDLDYRRATISYLELPVLAKWNLDIASFRFFALTGLSVEYAVAIRATHLMEENYLSEKISFQDIDLQRFDYGLTLGAGVEWKISRAKKVFVDFRHYLGLADLDPSENGTLFNEGTVIQIGFSIPLKKAVEEEQEKE